MQEIKNIGLIAHDARKTDLVEWVSYNICILRNHNLICTGTTGQLVQGVFDDLCPEAGKVVLRLKSGPLGGDQQMGALFVISSPLFSRHYQPVETDYDGYVKRLC